MPGIAKLRRTWFALLREAGVQDEDRHWLQEQLTGKRSTRDWTPEDWDHACASLQRDLGQHNDRHAHVRAERPGGVAPEPGSWCTDEQARYIHDLTERVEWKVGPVAYVCRVILRGDHCALRRELLRRERDRGVSGPTLWKHLAREEARRAIRALEKAARVYPREVSHVASPGPR